MKETTSVTLVKDRHPAGPFHVHLLGPAGVKTGNVPAAC